MIDRFIGVDVQTSRGCPFAVLDADGNALDSGWLNDRNETARALRTVATRHAEGRPNRVAIGIDAPRVQLQRGREWYWSRKGWRACGTQDRGSGRHCEVVIAAHRLANPQWTPAQSPFPQWMQLGFELFEELGKDFTVYEVFPSASYAMFAGDPSANVNVLLGGFAPGPKDMLDAYVAATTTREFIQGRGIEVGGGDGLGSIILPRPLSKAIHGVLTWPTAANRQSTHEASGSTDTTLDHG